MSDVSIMSTKDYNCRLFPFEREDCLSIQEAKQNMGWNVSAFDLPKAWEFTQGEGVTIAVIDTGCDLDHPDLKSNLLPGFNAIDPSKSPEDDNGHGCVSPECLVHTNWGGIQDIESLYDSIDSEEIASHHVEGEYLVKQTYGLKTYSFDTEKQQSVIGEIQSIQKLPIKGDVVNIELEGGTTYQLTPWHPVYLIKNRHHKVYDIIRKRADEIEIGDQFIFGRGENCGSLGEPQFIDLPANFICNNCKHQPKYWKGHVPTKCKKCNKSNWNQQVEFLEIDIDLAYLAGIVLTDGHVVKDRFEVTSETEEILNKVYDIAVSKGWKSTIEDNRVLVYSKHASNTMVAMGIIKGRKSIKQNLPQWVGMSNKEIQAAFIAGVIDGDGCISKSNTKNRITTASYVFAREMDCLLNSWGMSSYTSNPQIDGRNRNIRSKHPVYHIVHTSLPLEIVEHLVHPKKITRSQIEPRSARVGRRVKTVSTKQYNGYFYDFTVKEYHNYIAEGHFVSNTHVTGTLIAENNEVGMVGVCPKAKVLPVKVLNEKGNGNMMNVAKGIKWAIEQNVDFISMSLGTPIPVAAVRKAIKEAHQKGIITFVAAGNAGNTKEVFYPAAYPETIAIGAVDINMHRANFSNTGKNLDFMAPGVDIYSTVPDDWYAKMSGTSMAQPFVCGVAALVKSYVKKNKPDFPLKTAIDYRKLFLENTIPIIGDNYDDPKFYQGFGIIDPRKFMESIHH